jgi:hypothetical protein
MSDATERLRTLKTGKFYGLHLLPLPLEEGPGRQGAHRPKGRKMGQYHDVAEQHRPRIIRTTQLFDGRHSNEFDPWLSEPGYERVTLDEVQVGDEAIGWMKNNLRATLVVGVGRKNFTLASSSPSAIVEARKYGKWEPLITVKAVPKEKAGPFRRPVATLKGAVERTRPSPTDEVREYDY